MNLGESAWRCVDRRDRPALWYHDSTLDYGELFDLGFRVAAALTEWGIARGQRVLLPMLDTPAMVASFLGCLNIGAVPVPLNPKLGRETLAYIVRDSAAAAIVCERDACVTAADVIAGVARDSRPLAIVQDLYPGGVSDGSWLSLSHALALPPRQQFVGLAEDEAAFWQYTSGTTGEPKAVKHHSRGMVESNRCYARDLLAIDREDRIYSTAKMFFGYGLGNSLVFCLLNQACALLDDRWPTPAVIAENIRRFQPTVLFSVPALYGPLREYGAQIAAQMGPRARFVSAGSQLPAPLFRTWKERFGIELLDGIGATEMGHIFISNRPGSAVAGSTGTPVLDYRAELRSASGDAVRDGEHGVLWVHGPSTSLGYHERPESTQQRFRDGWYRTGDVFTSDGHGGFAYVGREDDLFKVKGQWVAPAQIEQFVLSRFPQIKEAALVPRETADGLFEPMLFLAASDDEALVAHVAEAIAAQFESHKRPMAYRVIEALPKNDNGKLVRKHLIDSARRELHV